jgi:uracil-DNA glycosylase family 4
MIQPKHGPHCAACPLYEQGIPVSDALPLSDEWSGLTICGEMPGSNEVRERVCFVGQSGKLLLSVLRSIGLEREQVHFTNAQRCGLQQGKKLDDKAALVATECCREVLFPNLLEVGSRCVVAAGAVAWYAFTGLAKILAYRGATLPPTDLDPYWLVATVHPAYILRDSGVNHMIDILGADVTKAMRLARGTPDDLASLAGPKVLPATFENVMWLLTDAHEAKGPAAIDIETDGIDIMTANLTTIGVSFRGQAVSIPFPAVARYYTAQKFDWILNKLRSMLSDPEMSLIFQNLNYDVPVLERCL